MTSTASPAAQVADLGTTVCVVPQSTYLGGYTVADAFSPADPLRFGLAVVLLVGFPLFAAMFVAAQARLALRRGPSWPAKFFWLPTAGARRAHHADARRLVRAPVDRGRRRRVPRASSAVLLVGAPSREVVHRSLAAPAPAPRRPSQIESVRRPTASREPVRSRPPPGVPADRLARRFAARQPEPPVVPAPRPAAPQRSAAPPRGPAGGPRPTLVAPAPPSPGALSLAALSPGRCRRRCCRWRRAPVPADPPARLRRVRPGLAGPRRPARAPGGAQGRARPRPGDRGADPARGPGAGRRAATRTACASTTCVPATSDPGLAELDGLGHRDGVRRRLRRSASWCALAARSTTSPPPGSGPASPARSTRRTPAA